MKRFMLLLLLSIAVFAGIARASYPGETNGRLAFGTTVDGNTDVYSVLPNGEALHRLTDDPGFDACPAYSADGTSIAWCGIPSPTGSGAGGIKLMKQNGKQKRQLASFGTWPDFSPDGSKVVFSGRRAGRRTWTSGSSTWTAATSPS